MLLSRNSRALIEVCTLPSSLTYVEMKLLEGAFQCFALLTPTAFRCSFSRELLQVFAYQTCKRGVSLNGDLPHFFHDLLVQRKGNIHVPIIRDSLIMGKFFQDLDCLELSLKRTAVSK